MPGGDRTGPLGMGPATGRGAGFCRGNAMPGYANRWGGFGRGGYGRGWRNRFLATGAPGWAWNWEAAGSAAGRTQRSAGARTQERRQLEEQAQFLKAELEDINRRLAELTTDKET